MKKVLSFLLLVCLAGVFCACASPESASAGIPQQTDSVAEPVQSDCALPDYAVKYDMKINPEFLVYADEALCVVAVTAENPDAEKVLARVDAVGLPVSDAFDLLAEEAENQGFLTEEKGNTVKITILEKDDEVLPTCHICGGCGTIQCAECGGTGILYDTCDLCNSTGVISQDSSEVMEWQPCSECGGLGYTSAPDEGCWACHGSGVCYLCGGSGTDIVTNEYGEIVYISEGVPETDACTFCKGSGQCTNCLGIPCHRCNTDGQGEKPGYEYTVVRYETETECPDCHGLGYIPCGDSFNGYNWCPCCWGSGIDGTGDPDYEKWMNDHGY